MPGQKGRILKNVFTCKKPSKLFVEPREISLEELFVKWTYSKIFSGQRRASDKKSSRVVGYAVKLSIFTG